MRSHKLTSIVGLSCDQASRLASESLDRELSRRERWALRVHTVFCRSCHRMMRQLKTLRALMADFPDAAQRRLRTTLPQLSPERKQQIKQLLTEARRKEQG